MPDSHPDSHPDRRTEEPKVLLEKLTTDAILSDAPNTSDPHRYERTAAALLDCLIHMEEWIDLDRTEFEAMWLIIEMALVIVRDHAETADIAKILAEEAKRC